MEGISLIISLMLAFGSGFLIGIVLIGSYQKDPDECLKCRKNIYSLAQRKR